MLQQILKDMYIDPDVLNALNDDQKKTLFLKMRQEQVRRWKEREEKLQEEHEENKTTKPKRANSKSVSWLLGRDGDVSVLVIGDVDELTSKFICSGFGENKAQSHQSNSYLQTILKSRKSTEAVKSERENVVCTTRPGISVNVKEKHEATNTSLPLLVSVSERSSPSAAHQRELKSQLSICSSSPERVSPVDTRPGLADMRQSAPSVPSHCGTTAATSSNMCSKEPQQSQESHDVAASEASRRAASGGAGASGRGRVAQLMKTFSVESSAQNQARGIKPPLPAKPNHLRVTSTPTVR